MKDLITLIQEAPTVLNWEELRLFCLNEVVWSLVECILNYKTPDFHCDSKFAQTVVHMLVIHSGKREDKVKLMPESLVALNIFYRLMTQGRRCKQVFIHAFKWMSFRMHLKQSQQPNYAKCTYTCIFFTPLQLTKTLP